MSGTRGGLGRIVAMGIGLAIALLLTLAGEARAGRYAVAQCGWYVGADADWADNTGGAKFRPDGYCVPPPGADPFDGVHLKSFTRDGEGTVSGTRFARWRWVAPPGTGITQVRGTWWQALHDGIEQRIGAGDPGGGFEPFLIASTTDTALRDFVQGFPSPVPAIEDRLLCARAESKWCSLDAGSWSALRALTITIEDNTQPAALLEGANVEGGWRRGALAVAVGGLDGGAGVRFGETRVDGARVDFSEYGCEKVSIGGQWMGTRMQPCPTGAWATHTIATDRFSDGPHTVVHCAEDFAGNGACTGDHTVLIDNNPPAPPRATALAGGDGWRRTNRFDVSWGNPDQAPASPIVGAGWRLVGTAGFDTGAQFAAGWGLSSLENLRMPGPGAYSLQLWLRDEAGNEAPGSAVTLPLRFDDLAPAVAFATDAPDGQLRADIVDPHSGPAGGSLFYRRADSARWIELAARLVPGSTAAVGHLVAPMPELGLGTYLFRAEAGDGAGNTAATTLRSDGTEMAVRKVAPAVIPKAQSRLFARLRGGRGSGDALTIPFGATAVLSGRLTRADESGIPGRELQIVQRPSREALAPVTTAPVLTGPEGGFELRLEPGPSRRLAVAFPGDGGLEAATRPSLELRVRSGVSLQASPRRLHTGETVRLSGRVEILGAAPPRRGKLVAIQYLESATHRWRPVLVTHAAEDGRFRARYRFRYVKGRASIRLRATALPEEHWPYAPGSSPSVNVRVTG